MVTYNATPTFNEKNNFNQIVFGEGAPLLEVELNELQDIISDQFKRLGEGIFKRDGFVKLDSNFKTNGLLTVSGLAFLGGAFIRVSNLSLTLLSGESAYLAYKTATVTPTSTVKEYGNQTSSTTVPNKLKDARVGDETSRRKQMTYTILKTNTDTSYSYIKLGTVSTVSGALVFTLNSDAKVATVSDEMLNYIAYLEKNFVSNSIQIVDARTINSGKVRTPKQYRQLLNGKETKGHNIYEFGTGTMYSLPSGQFAVVETNVGWSDTSGGNLIQRAYPTNSTNFVFIRSSTGQTTTTIDTEVWGEWDRLALVSDVDSKIATASTTINTTISTHVNDKNNPHGVTKSQVGLGSVSNYGLATQAEAQAGTSSAKYMTPLRTKEAIDTLVPGATTSVAGKVKLEDVATSTSTTTAPTSNALKVVKDTLDTHANDKSNPHGVTKTQVGLGSVHNWGVASTAEAQGGTVNTGYMTPLRVKEAIASLVPSASTSVAGKVQLVNTASSTSTTQAPTANALKTVLDLYNTHVGSKQNPHGVNTTQVTHLGQYVKKLADPQTAYPLGVSSMFVKADDGDGWQSYGTVLTVRSFDTGGGTLQIYTPYSDGYGGTNLQFRTWKYQATDWSAWSSLETTAGAQAKVDAHANNKNNPHAVTKSQVGLGSVLNYGIATTAEAQAGTVDNKYMTPLKVKDAISSISLARKTETIGATSDWNTFLTPGFYSVQADGGLNATYNAPPGAYGYGNLTVIKGANDTFAVTQLYTAHSTGLAYLRVGYSSTRWSTWSQLATASDLTKSKVGLGSVENYAISTQAEAQAGTVNNKYMTPLRVKETINALVPAMVPKNTETATKLGNAITITDFTTFKPSVVTVQGEVTPIKFSEATPGAPWSNTGSGLLILSNPSVNSFHLYVFRSGEPNGIAYASYYSNKLSAWSHMETTAGAQAKATTVNTALTTHINNKSNPHGVTKAQVGLGNVDNTSDVNKPVSTAMQTALNGKLSKTKITAVTDLNTFTTTGVYSLNYTGGANQPTSSWGTLFVEADMGTPYQLYIADGNRAEMYKRSWTSTTWTAWTALKLTDTVYTHPTTDGNLHVPATGTTNSGKVLKAGATAGSISWGTLAKGDVALGNVNNWGVATTAEAQAGTSDSKYMTPNRTREAINALGLPIAGTVSGSMDFNTILAPGVYNVADMTATLNKPTDAYNYGVLLVMRGNNSTVGLTQMYVTHTAPANELKAPGHIYVRTGWGGASANRWTTWSKIANSDDIADISYYNSHGLGGDIPFLASTNTFNAMKRGGAYRVNGDFPGLPTGTSGGVVRSYLRKTGENAIIHYLYFTESMMYFAYTNGTSYVPTGWSKLATEDKAVLKTGGTMTGALTNNVSVTSPTFKTGSFEIKNNSSLGTLDFVYNG